ncbi:TetR/AcrR family transcriptional regulator [Mucilaginibacter sp. SP1R1]|uniref:TetR/AcrR family transcriptional regulator n=1 Tax=Mucilaginibacter sp. SP1R1 TaxID=2723091 RepID=UPI00160F9100|nr:TetR/AcrR family transcriptional regulator [Mucilaginibacter sp. SP1R1]MBB6149629.1 AcrR family transcriptional regulator [Mucilaginibacter sp. SP1R1]
MRPRDENKEQLIRQMAIEMIVKHGLDGFGVNKLAKAAGVSPATIYIYYKDKDDLINRLCVAVAGKMMSHGFKGFSPEMDFAEGLKIQWKNRMEYFINFPAEMEFIEIMRYTHYYEEVSKSITKDFGAILGPFMENSIAKKQLIPLPFEIYWAIAFAPLYQLIKYHYQGKSYVNTTFELNDTLMTQTLELVLKALKP